MTAFAYYRLPYLHHATYVAQHEGEPEVLSSVTELNGKEGFVVAPFSPSGECPVLLIHPDESKLLAIEGNERASRKTEISEETSEWGLLDDTVDLEKLAYCADFALFHEQLTQGTFRKIVLARKHTMLPSIHFEGALETLFVQAKRLFMRACRLYPRLFVALVYTERSGMWLMASPEILLKGDGCEMATMSLAGTQRAEPSRMVADYPVEGVEWSMKNREEQQYVTNYIEQCISHLVDDYSLKGPYTTMAANLYHLRTDIRFRLRDTGRLGDVLDRLYPTPAVCGIPKDTARQFIMQHEHHPRKYYSGFVGPLSPTGKTSLYVSLRCMNMQEDGTCELYAGGGLLKESEMEREWQETEAKLGTILQVLR